MNSSSQNNSQENFMPPGLLEKQETEAKAILTSLESGLTLTDALVLVDWTEEDLGLYKHNHPKYARVVEKYKVKYKAMLMKPINDAVKSGDENMAQWLLERQFSEEFTTKKKSNDEMTQNPITFIINQIQDGKMGKSILPGSYTKFLEPDTQLISPPDTLPDDQI